MGRDSDYIFISFIIYRFSSLLLLFSLFFLYFVFALSVLINDGVVEICFLFLFVFIISTACNAVLYSIYYLFDI